MQRRGMTIVVGLVLGVLVAAGAAAAFDGATPVPVPGQLHVFAPGPKRLGLQGFQANPSSIGDFAGTVALTYVRGQATSGDGHRFLMLNDMRVMQGTYLAADGSQHHGTFAFV